MVPVTIPVTPKVSVTVAVPAMVMLEAPAIALPVAFEKHCAVMTRPHPTCVRIRGPGPVAVVPSVVVPDRIPVTINPEVVRSRNRRTDVHHTGRRRGTDPNPDGNLSAKSYSGGQEKNCQ